MKKPALILSCEHASSYIPEMLQEQLPPLPSASFAVCDLYAKALTESIAHTLKCDYILGNISRYVIDLNKNHPLEHGFSTWVQPLLSKAQKKIILEQFYLQYRQSIKTLIEQHIAAEKQVLHISIHSFNPQESNGLEHDAAIGILYDSKHHGEREVARIWHEILTKRTPYRVRLNYPRSGRHDNLTSYLRKHYCEENYLGLELECNALLLSDSQEYQQFSEDLSHSIFSLVEML